MGSQTREGLDQIIQVDTAGNNLLNLRQGRATFFTGEDGLSALVYSNQASGTSVENTTTETVLATKTINGALLKVGDVIEVIGHVWVEDNNSTDTLTVKLYVGTEEIVTTGAVDVADNDVGYIHAHIVVTAIGASGAVRATGVVGLGVPGTVTAKPFRKASATEDISGNIAIAMKATWSVAHADNECEMEEFIVKLHQSAS
jgi:hypothetical protein